MKNVSYLLCLVFLISCSASKYKPSNEVYDLKSSMNKSSAVAVVENMLGKKPGLCYALSNRLQVAPVIFKTLSDDILQYRVDVVVSKTVTGISMPIMPTANHGGLISISIRENHQYETYGMTLTKLTKIRVQNEHFQCTPVSGGFIVAIDTDEEGPNFGGQNLAIAVNDSSDLNSLIAALTYLSPKARLIEGMGF